MRTGTLSPVSMFSSTMASPPTSTASQGSVPSGTANTSPGTSALLRSRNQAPPRRTSTGHSKCASAAMRAALR